MKLDHPLITNTAGLAAAAWIRWWMSSLDRRFVLADPLTDMELDVPDRRVIYVFWHEYILPPLYRCGLKNITILLSRHDDADILERVAGHLGYNVVRGSTFDGGSAALRALLKTSRRNHLGISTDGPRGPRRVMSLGPIYLAAKLGMSIVPMGFGYDRPWRLNSWDRFAIPRPFSRCRGIFGPAMHVPRRADRDELEQHRQRVERVLLELTDEAEAWAASGERRPGERPFNPGKLRRIESPPPGDARGAKIHAA
jgi:lysophospholipid acyltransferase (LPLAT)-like uncharacterized protein